MSGSAARHSLSALRHSCFWPGAWMTHHAALSTLASSLGPRQGRRQACRSKAKGNNASNASKAGCGDSQPADVGPQALAGAVGMAFHGQRLSTTRLDLLNVRGRLAYSATLTETRAMMALCSRCSSSRARASSLPAAWF